MVYLVETYEKTESAEMRSDGNARWFTCLSALSQRCLRSCGRGAVPDLARLQWLRPPCSPATASGHTAEECGLHVFLANAKVGASVHAGRGCGFHVATKVAAMASELGGDLNGDWKQWRQGGGDWRSEAEVETGLGRERDGIGGARRQ